MSFLDMGETLSIVTSLSRWQMVRLSGLFLRDARNPNCDIEIIRTYLNPGKSFMRSY